MTFDFICNIVKARLLLFSPGDGSFFSQQGISRIGEMLNLVAQCLSVCHSAISKKKRQRRKGLRQPASSVCAKRQAIVKIRRRFALAEDIKKPA